MVLYITGPSILGDFQNEATLWNANYLKYIITMARLESSDSWTEELSRHYNICESIKNFLRQMIHEPRRNLQTLLQYFD